MEAQEENHEGVSIKLFHYIYPVIWGRITQYVEITGQCGRVGAFLHVGPRNRTQVAELAYKCPHPLSHAADPISLCSVFG